MTRRIATVVGLGATAVVLAASGCSSSDTDSTSDGAAASTPAAASSTPQTSTPSGPPVGTATMQVTGGSGSVTIRYTINGGPEETETGVTLPWQKDYPVYDKLQTSVSADAGDAALLCTITMDGKLLSVINEPRPTCNFAYWG